MSKPSYAALLNPRWLSILGALLWMLGAEYGGPMRDGQGIPYIGKSILQYCISMVLTFLRSTLYSSSKTSVATDNLDRAMSVPTYYQCAQRESCHACARLA
ncbi:hypothetical protein V8E55_003596 [Tylopilus felleus]